MDAKIVQVALNGLENILRLGEQEAKATGGINSYAVLIEGCYGNVYFRDYLIRLPNFISGSDTRMIFCHDKGVLKTTTKL